MTQPQLFASFLLDRSVGLEIALKAESVAEATPVTGRIQRLPASLDFVEGIMHLREEVIPLINLKKRLGLVQQEYDETAKVAVVKLFHRRYGLLFDDIQEVFAVEAADINKVDSALQTEDKVISSLITLEKGKRTVELLDLNNLFPGNAIELEKIGEALLNDNKETRVTRYSRYVVFAFAEQLYGVPVEYTQEITFFDAVNQMYRGGVEEPDPPFSSSIEDLFKHGDIDGSLTLRGRTIPVLNARRLLAGPGVAGDEYLGENTRILVVSDNTFAVGLIVEEVKAIESIPEDDILPLGGGGNDFISGIYQKKDGLNILLLNMDNLVQSHSTELKALARLSSGSEVVKDKGKEAISSAHHLITENCYLVFWIGKHMAVQLKDVQEIIEKTGVLGLPGASAFKSGVINLRGLVVPVINLREFYGYAGGQQNTGERKLIICRSEATTVALEVDGIVTIYKQEQYQTTTSIKKDLAKRRDTLDRLIVYEQEDKRSEHVLVVNIHNLIRNHLGVDIA
ncbi:MAG: chemotaxis protein CheW [Proteobacteria bacterium]|nr:chemotaxis protein CheW [Pseudomonadota bacterium]